MTQPGRPLDAAVPVFIIGVNIHLNIHWRKLLFRKKPQMIWIFYKEPLRFLYAFK